MKLFTTKAGLRACIKQNGIGYLCGYVEVPNNPSADPSFDVHGGITWNGLLEDEQGNLLSDNIWYGFDCAHAYDAPDPEWVKLNPRRNYFNEGGTFRDEAYVAAECEKLASQIVGRGKKWFALMPNGEMRCIGKHENFDSAAEHSPKAIWLADAETAQQWLDTLKGEI